MDTQTNQVEWKPIPGTKYLVSNTGVVKPVMQSRTGLRITSMSTYVGARGYLTTTLRFLDGTRKGKCVHLLVAECFHGLRPPGLFCNHKDGNKHNNNATNLEWVTAKENTQHAHDTGLCTRGKTHHYAKLTEWDVREIRRLFAAKTYSGPELAKQFGVNHTAIYKIVHRRVWKHII